MSRYHSLRVRYLCFTLIAGQVGLGVPMSARPASSSAWASDSAFTSVPGPLPAPEVWVNRTVPEVERPSSVPIFSDRPTVDEIFRARVFGEPLVAVGGVPSDTETASLASAVVRFHRGGGVNPRGAFGPFLAAHPRSPWRASLLANIGVVEARTHR